jgi:hypothetical protein
MYKSGDATNNRQRRMRIKECGFWRALVARMSTGDSGGNDTTENRCGKGLYA